MLALLLAGAVTAASPLADAERAFVVFRDADDRARVRPSARHERVRREQAARSLALLYRVDSSRVTEEDRRAVAAMRRVLSPVAEAEDGLTKSVYQAFGRAAEALRDRVRVLRGADVLSSPSPALYGWLSNRLYRYGLERSSRRVVEEFLGGPLTPGPLLSVISGRRGGP